MRKALKAAVSAEYISDPHPVVMPIGAPFHAAICAVALPAGCLQQPGYPTRIATGRGPDAEAAAFVAMAEAVERYALQYSTNRPQTFEPFAAYGGEALAADAANIMIGAPQATTIVDSVGTAAGENRTDAGRRALLEYLEHLDAAEICETGNTFCAVDADTDPLRPYSNWLAGQFRCLDVRLMTKHGYYVAVCRCTDRDGGRLTEGSAAGSDDGLTIRRATEEAIFHWRNMVEIERQGPDLRRMSSEDVDAIARYRGAAPSKLWAIPLADRPHDVSGNELDVNSLAQLLVQRTGKRVRLFDLSVPGIAVSVVRAHLG